MVRRPKSTPRRTPLKNKPAPSSVEVTDRHRTAARELLSLDGSHTRVESVARRLAVLEEKTREATRTVIRTERRIVGDTDRWVELVKTSPSGKTLFVCRSCGTISPAPTKRCAQPVKHWSGELRECADWEPTKPSRAKALEPGLRRALDLVRDKLSCWPPFNEGYGFGQSVIKDLEKALNGD